ncbi:MAG: hypothetical protein ACPGJS_22675 [Flammeovirgaceae bacterium]
MNHYYIYNLQLSTHLNLPLPLAPQPNGQTDLFLTQEELPEKTDKTLVAVRDVAGFQRSEIYQMPDGNFATYVYRENNCSLYVKNGQELIIHPEMNLENNKEHFVFFMHIAFSSLLYQRHYLLFHGSAIAYKGKGYIFVGHSGAGKSTIASSLLQQGGRFLADDICFVFAKDHRYYVSPSYNFTKLTPTTFNKFQPVNRFFTDYSLLEEGKFLCQLHPNYLSSTPVELTKIFHVSIDNQKETHVKALKGMDALQRLLHNAARPDGLKLYNMENDFYKDCFLLNTHLKVLDIYRKHDEFIAPEVIQFLDQSAN